MKILVDNEIKDLIAIGKNNVEWTRDLLGDYNALSYNEDKEMYTMSADDFEWWMNIVDKLNQIKKMECELTGNDLIEYYSETCGCCDLKTEIDGKFNWLSEKLRANG